MKGSSPQIGRQVTGLGIGAAASRNSRPRSAQDGQSGSMSIRGLLPGGPRARLAYITDRAADPPAQTAQWNAFADIVAQAGQGRDIKVRDAAKWSSIRMAMPRST